MARTAEPTHQHARALMAAGFLVVAGVDEVGRGAWAGPVVAGAVILSPRSRLVGVTDSKLLTPRHRTELAALVTRRAIATGLGWVSAAELDTHGLTWAVTQSGLRALAALDRPYDAVLLDGKHNYLRDHCYAETIIRGDQLSYSIAAASIIAKVARDQFMAEQHEQYPAYNFIANKGYGTADHQAALANHGPTPLHRHSYKPVQLAASA